MDNELQRFAALGLHGQGGEDGMIGEVVRRLGIDHGWFVELGAGDGDHLSNTRMLAERGWRGLWIEGDDATYEKLAASARRFPLVETRRGFVDCEPGTTLDDAMDSAHVPQDFDVLSLDIDGNDYWVWKSLKRRPKLVVVERNSNFAGEESLTVRYEPGLRFNNDDYHGATAMALWKLAGEKRYTLIGWQGVNLFFLRDDLMSDKFTTQPISTVPRYRCWKRSERDMVEV